MLTPSPLQTELADLAIPVLTHADSARSANLAESAAQRTRAQILLLLSSFAALPTDAVWLNGAEIDHDPNETGSTAPTAPNGQILSAIGFTVLIESRKWQGVVTIEAIQLIGRVHVLATGAIDIWHEQACPLLLQLAIRLPLNTNDLFFFCLPLLVSSLGHVILFQPSLAQ